MSDTAFLNRMLIACSRGAVRLFRNPVGKGLLIYAKSPAQRRAIIDACKALAKNMGGGASETSFGLIEGSGDLIGWESRTIRPEHIGQTWAVFASVEGKQGSDRLRPAQIVWRDQVRAAGGIADVARSPEEARAMFSDER